MGEFFCAKMLCAAFLYLQFDFVTFWQKKIGEKAACKMLMKFTRTVVERLWHKG